MLSAAGKMTTSKGKHIPMAPLLSWLYFPSQCAVRYGQTQDVLATIDRLGVVLQPQPNPLPIVHFWSGRDNETSSSDPSCAIQSTAQLDWLRGASIVPKRCLPAQRLGLA